MLWSYVQLDDDTQFACLGTREGEPFAKPSNARLTLALTMRNSSCLRSNGSTSKDLLLMTSTS